MRHLVQATIALLVCLLLVLAGTDAQAFSLKQFIHSPGRTISGALGEVAGGIGGILGQGLNGLASPTIHTATEDMRKLLDEAAQKADQAGTKLIDKAQQAALISIGKAGEEYRRSFNETVVPLLASADQLVQTKIEDVDRRLDQKVGALEIVAVKSIQTAEDSFVKIVRYFAILVCIAALIFVVSYMIVTRSPRQILSSRFAVLSIATCCGTAIVLILVSSWLSPPAGDLVRKMTVDFEKSAARAIAAGQLDQAVALSKQLTVLSPTDVRYQALHDISSIGRDILSRPASYRTAQGANDLLVEVERLKEYMTTPEVGADDSISTLVRQEYNATVSVLMWQLANDSSSRDAALCAAIEAFDAAAKTVSSNSLTKEATSGNGAPGTPFLWLAGNYLRWQTKLYNDFSVLCEGRSGKANEYDRKRVVELIDGVLPASSAPPSIVAHVVRYNDYATEYYATASEAYTRMVIFDLDARKRFSLKPTLSPDITDRVKRRDEAADSINAAWTKFLAAVAQDTRLKASDITLASSGFPVAFTLRANAYKGAQPVVDAAGTPSFTVVAPYNGTCAGYAKGRLDPAVDLNQFPPDQAISLVQEFRPNVGVFVCAEAMAAEAALQKLEGLLTATLHQDTGTTAKNIKSNKDEFGGIMTSLTVCMNLVRDPNISFEACSDPEKRTDLVTWLLKEGSEDAGDKPWLQYAMVR
ncbi:hypothetical protein N185_16450 [Sinorhizobium sp. GW3]|nr:hypothetical protein N185_16450 [Sinorhizobium sp. GW3]